MSRVEKVAYAGAVQLAILAVAFFFLSGLKVFGYCTAGASVLYVGLGLAVYISRKRNATTEANFYVMCVTPRDLAKGLLWSGPYHTEQEAEEEISDSKRLVGHRDSLYVVDKRSYPPPKSL